MKPGVDHMPCLMCVEPVGVTQITLCNKRAKKTVARNIAKNLAIANRSRSASYISPSEFRSNLTVKIIVHLQKFFSAGTKLV